MLDTSSRDATTDMSKPHLHDSLESFLRADENTVTRERLLFHRFCLDMYLGAARARYPLSVLSIEVDREGFDVVLDDGDRERRIQLKVVDGTTGSWSVPKRLLRPEAMIAHQLRFPSTIEGIGIGGAVVVMEYRPTLTDIFVRYLFCDAHILAARASGWINANGRPGNPSKVAKKKLDELRTGIGSEQIDISKGLFVEARDPDHLLALLEMHSVQDHQWCHMLRLRLGEGYDVETHGPVEEQIAEDLARLVVF